MKSCRTMRLIRIRTYRFSQVGENEMIVYDPATAATVGMSIAKTAGSYLLGKLGNALFPGKTPKAPEPKMPQIQVQPQVTYNPKPHVKVSFDGSRSPNDGAVSGSLYQHGVSGGVVNGRDLHDYTPPKKPRKHNRIHAAN